MESEDQESAMEERYGIGMEENDGSEYGEKGNIWKEKERNYGSVIYIGLWWAMVIMSIPSNLLQ